MYSLNRRKGFRVSNISDFIDRCVKIANDLQIVCQKSSIYIYSHFDADGLTSASIIITALTRAGFTFQVRILERLEYDFLDTLNNTLPEGSTVIFLDLGTGMIETFIKWNSSFNIFILDHHTPSELNIDLPQNIRFLNSHFFSIDGTTEISGAGIAYFIAININPENKDLATLAMIGALGDRQDNGEHSALSGLNELIVQDGLEYDIISENITVWFFDRARPIITVLKSSSIPNLLNELEISTFLENIEIPIKKENTFRTFYDLNEEECRKIASELIIQYGADPNELYKHDYRLKHEKMTFLSDLRVFATKLNACGRSKRPDVGIALCLGERNKSLRDLKLIEQEYRMIIAKNLNWAFNEGNLQELSAIHVLDGRQTIDERIIGTIISMISSNRNIKPKPILGVANMSPEKVKISMRTPNFLKSQIDLSELLLKATRQIEPGTEVGGHQAAAGAIISESFLQDFINLINQLVLEEIK